MTFRQAPPPSAAMVAAHRREVEELAAAGDKLAIITLEGWAKAAALEPTSGPVSIARLLPIAAKEAAAPGERIVNPKIQDADVDKYRAPNFAAPSWWNRANAAIEKRRVGVRDVSAITLKSCCNALARRFNWGRGSARLAMETLAKDMGSCEDTARRSIRYLQRHDVVNVMNTLIRDENNMLVRAPNLYLATRPEQAPIEDPSDLSPKLTQLARAGAVVARWASYFVGLVSRDLGLNRTPLAGARRRTEGRATQPA